MFWVFLFPNVNLTLKAEKVLKEKGIPYKLIPVPKHISSDCGVCIRVKDEDLDRVRDALKDFNVRIEKLSF